MQNRITITLELNTEQAWALAQLVKRIGWSQVRSLAEDDAQALEMVEAIHQMRRALAEAGYEPR